jgi:peptide/nickel transport system permease protein
MLTFIFRRLIQALFVLLIVTMLVFLIVRLLPSDPIVMYLSQTEANQMNEEQLDALRHEFGLDKSLPAQYADWITDVLHGDFGRSILKRIPITQDIIGRLPVTFHLGILAFILSFIIGIPIGVISAVRRGKWQDTTVTFLANIGITIPSFWLAIILVYIFALKLNWLPVQGYTSPFTDFWLNTRQVILPVFCMCIFPVASSARQTRSAMLEVMHQDYVRTAWSKGITERAVIFKHALKNALIPVITLKGMSFSMLIGGSVIIETVFNIPGMGRLAVTSVVNQDYAYVQGIALIVAFVVVMGNLATDIINSWLDPRIRYA